MLYSLPCSYTWLSLVWMVLALASVKNVIGVEASKYLQEETGWCPDYSVAFTKAPILYKSKTLRVFLSVDIFAAELQVNLRVGVARWENKELISDTSVDDKGSESSVESVDSVAAISPSNGTYNYEVEGFGKYFVKFPNSKSFPFYVDVPLRKSFRNNALRETKAGLAKDEEIISFGYQVSVSFDRIQSAGTRLTARISTSKFDRFPKRRWYRRLNFLRWFKKGPSFKTASLPVSQRDMGSFYDDLPKDKYFTEAESAVLHGRCLNADFPADATLPRTHEVKNEATIRSFIPTPAGEMNLVRDQLPEYNPVQTAAKAPRFPRGPAISQLTSSSSSSSKRDTRVSFQDDDDVYYPGSSTYRRNSFVPSIRNSYQSDRLSSHRIDDCSSSGESVSPPKHCHLSDLDEGNESEEEVTSGMGHRGMGSRKTSSVNMADLKDIDALRKSTKSMTDKEKRRASELYFLAHAKSVSGAMSDSNRSSGSKPAAESVQQIPEPEVEDTLESVQQPEAIETQVTDQHEPEEDTGEFETPKSLIDDDIMFYLEEEDLHESEESYDKELENEKDLPHPFIEEENSPFVDESEGEDEDDDYGPEVAVISPRVFQEQIPNFGEEGRAEGLLSDTDDEYASATDSSDEAPEPTSISAPNIDEPYDTLDDVYVPRNTYSTRNIRPRANTYRFGDRILDNLANAVTHNEGIPQHYPVTSTRLNFGSNYDNIWTASEPQTIPPKDQVMHKSPSE